MSIELYADIVREVCGIVGLPDAEHVLRTRTIEVEGFEVQLDHFENDPQAMYVNFHYGTITAGRTLVVFRLLLEANLVIYAQDQAQLGLDTDTGGIVLIVRLPLEHDVNGNTVADLLSHYAEHGRYWRSNIIESSDEMFQGIVAGDYFWLRA
ncbi:CesT family type III secretion system chaperone [Burkholderia ambifaria]|uniref:CesT family type III secretion system chaperone n=1 Tax=Burkholderia ambifaria TaxID=152480 RepID=A0AA41E962_9BURK|nr:CesT family type III secretion system chaperone [Burkholderia ambifaria]MBR8130771.1 CesT family type III secretion system chaperone [Burkholderia ambifaria]PRD96952.1 molecular chaperone Tir [Burkholderia ambifaria]